MTEKNEPVRCRCGRESCEYITDCEVPGEPGIYHDKHCVECLGGDCGCRGPLKDTPEMATAAWNEMMGEPWTPVEKGLPEEKGFYEITLHEKCLDQHTPPIRVNYFHLESETLDHWWSHDAAGNHHFNHELIIAWRNLPAPYRAEESEGEVS